MSQSVAVFNGRLGLQQRVIPAYRAAFLERLAQSCQGGLSVFAGQPLAGEGIQSASEFERVHLTPARNWHFGVPGSPWFVLWQAGILRWLQTWQPDALIVEANARYLSTRAAVAWMRRRRRLVVGWGLGAPPAGGKLAGLRQGERLAFLRSLDGVIAYSHKGAAEYIHLGLPPEKVFVAPNAVEPPPVRQPSVKPAEFAGKPVVIFVGRLQARKRVDLLLHACARLPAARQPALRIVGEGPARRELEALASQIYPAAQFVGAQFGADLAASLEAADLFVLPGTGGLAVQQAMAHGLPVIVAQGDGTQEDLVRPENGWLIPADDLNALTQALAEALLDPQRLRRMGAESYRIVAQEINIDQMAGAFIAALNRLPPSG